MTKPFNTIPMLATLLAATSLTAPAFAQEFTVWGGYPEMVPFYEHVAEGLKADYPDLKVTFESIALREHEKRIALGLSSGDRSVKVIELAGSTAARYIENDLIPAAPPEAAAFVSDPQNFGSFFVDAVSYDGTVYGMPLFRGQGALYYNTEKFAAAGLTEPPKTMEQFSEYAEKLTERDSAGAPVVAGWSLRLSGGGQGIAEKFWINLFQFGGNLLVQTEDGKWKADYANEAGQKALAQYLDLVFTKNTVTPAMPADAEAFERGQAAMFIRESWVIGDIASKATDLPYATAPLPTGSIGLPTNLYVSQNEGPDAEAAWAFVQAANSPENLNWLLDNVGWLPNRSVDYSEVVAKHPGFAGFMDLPSDYKFFTLPAIAPIEEVLTRLAAQLTRAFDDPSLAGDAAKIQAYLAAAAAETNDILKREGLLAE